MGRFLAATIAVRTARHDEVGLMLVLTFVLTFGAVIPAFFLAGRPGGMSANVAIIGMVLIWSIVRLTALAIRGERRLTAMCFYIFIYVFMGIQPMVSIWTGAFPYPEPMPPSRIMVALAILIAGIIAYEIGYAFARRRRALDARHDRAAAHRPVWLLSLWIATAVVSALIVGAMARYGAGIYLGIRGGGLTFASPPGVSMSQAEWLFVVHGFRAMLAALLFIGLYLWSNRNAHHWPRGLRQRLGLTVVFLVIANLVISNPLNAARLWSGSVLVSAIFIARPWRGPRSFLIWTLAATTGLLVLFAGIDPRRIIAQPLLRGEAITFSGSVEIIQESIRGVQTDANFDAFQMIALSQGYTERHGKSMGRQVLLPMFFWVPRSLWSGKPIGTSDLVAESLSFASTNVGSPLWAEGYVNFGIFGVLLFLGLFGVYARISDDYLVRISGRTGKLIPTIAASFFAANTFILLRGDLTTGTMFLQMIVGLTALLSLLTRRPRTNRGVWVSHPGQSPHPV
jgi:hypothetical protein